jgi:hypothetical protein
MDYFATSILVGESVIRGFAFSEVRAYLSGFQRADERTRTADLISLRVIIQALQGFARDCKYRMDMRFPLLRLATCCTVLRSRWYQSDINIALLSA